MNLSPVCYVHALENEATLAFLMSQGSGVTHMPGTMCDCGRTVDIWECSKEVFTLLQESGLDFRLYVMDPETQRLKYMHV